MPTVKRTADLDGADFYPTPAWATHALMAVEKFEGDIWECACGNGAMSEVIKSYGYSVESSDLYDRGYGKSGIDFLNQSKKVPNIITNPPYNSAEGFVKRCVDLSSSKFALLLRLAFLESATRQKEIFNKNPPSRVWIFSERITFYPLNAEVKGSGTTAYAWFVWDKNAPTRTELRWIPVGIKSKYKTKVLGSLL